jgi:uncharacterized MAPEG superfamily protein
MNRSGGRLGPHMIMSIELMMLCFGIGLGFVHVTSSAIATTRQYGVPWNLGARDDPMPPLNPIAGRLQRASQNFLETFPFFAAAVLVANATNRHGLLVILGVNLYVWARLIYLPIYALGIPVVRTLVWSAATTGIALILLGLF